ncbi:PspC domain-containing protein [soil metagenome]
MSFPTNVLIRPARGRVVAGVCLAIANRFGWDVTTVRGVAAVACLFTGVGLAVYIAFWIAIPAGV